MEVSHKSHFPIHGLHWHQKEKGIPIISDEVGEKLLCEKSYKPPKFLRKPTIRVPPDVGLASSSESLAVKEFCFSAGEICRGLS